MDLQCRDWPRSNQAVRQDNDQSDLRGSFKAEELSGLLPVLRNGDVLMTVEASEFVQRQNDLIAARAQLNTATAAVRQSENNEDRLRQLYLAKAGVLKDWQQLQADLAAAQSIPRANMTC